VTWLFLFVDSGIDFLAGTFKIKKVLGCGFKLAELVLNLLSERLSQL